MFLELVSIIINCIFFSSILLLYRVSRASSSSVGKLRQWHVAFNIAAVKNYGMPLSPFAKEAHVLIRFIGLRYPGGLAPACLVVGLLMQ